MLSRQSVLFSRTRRQAPADEPSRNAALLEQAGYIAKLSAGVYSMLPLGLRVLRNVERVIRQEMDAIGGQEVLMPVLQPAANWETTGRDAMDVLFRTKNDRVVLGASAEEVVTPLLAAHATSYRDLPVAAYQIQTKFRDEPRAKSGLLRCREFGMKDMYSFHADEADFQEFYARAKAAYLRVFDRCGLGEVTYFTQASGGDFCDVSDEFQALTEYGEDTIYIDGDTGEAVNREIIDAYPAERVAGMEVRKGIEVGNIFPLGSRYSDAFGLRLPDACGVRQSVLMGCYGIGTTRLIGAIVEVLARGSSMVWPAELAPFGAHVLCLSHRAEARELSNRVASMLEESGIDVLLDDRDTTAGAKLADADLIGIGHRVVLGNHTLDTGKAEYTNRHTKEVTTLDVADLAAVLAA
ncbi:MAG TPA: aminoacyl--tRNA ligase-related protein [Stackebrandtia sp.]|jgi:prolyl-tRNA synthetase|uniref:aminoacyl--tRNA ligase-related protein n=1 Tax=Stackebrandtia sp. TaxID=2023065 RepID=UPI002D268EE1|nr:aminoacyl--tRNA ligase-related protein [Stackebrandtia sp.]HZE40766.1 aminoacyl--tRNA ligase-related protein [Stackebrandtia sp.]